MAVVDRPERAPFRVLFVCAANICRSPGAAALLSARWADPVSAGAVEVRSAGLRAENGTPSCATMSSLIGNQLPERDALAAHRSVRLSADDLRWADLVLTAERGQRSEIISLDPSRRGMTFTMNEAARLSAHWEGAAAASGPELVAQLNDLRGQTAPPTDEVARRGWRSRQVHQHPDDILDSHVWEDVAHRVTAKAITDAVGRLARLVPGRTTVG
jgi:protein-tyrosine phosphatase